MGRKDLLELVRSIAKLVILDDESMPCEEKVIRIKNLLIDVLTENDKNNPPTFGEGR